MTSASIGRLIRLRFDEWKEAKLYILRPIDRTDAELEAWREERRRKSSRKSKQKARAQKLEQREVIKSTRNRCEAVLRMLSNEDLLFPERRERSRRHEITHLGPTKVGRPSRA